MSIGAQEKALKRRIFDVQPMHPQDQKCACGFTMGANDVTCRMCGTLSKMGKQVKAKIRIRKETDSIQRRMLEAMTGNVR